MQWAMSSKMAQNECKVAHFTLSKLKLKAGTRMPKIAKRYVDLNGFCGFQCFSDMSQLIGRVWVAQRKVALNLALIWHKMSGAHIDAQEQSMRSF